MVCLSASLHAGRGILRHACLLVLVLPAQCAYFVVEEGIDKCFHQNMVHQQVLRMSYTMHGDTEGDVDLIHAECRIVVRNPNGEAVKEHALVNGSHSGALAHLAHADGPHSICVHCEPQGWFTRHKMRWSIAFDILGVGFMGAASPDPAKLASMAAFKGAQSGIELLLSRLTAISSENDYEKTFEAQFVKTSDAVNVDIAAFRLMEIVLISGITLFQIAHLSKFFQTACVGALPCMPMFKRSVA